MFIWTFRMKNGAFSEKSVVFIFWTPSLISCLHCNTMFVFCTYHIVLLIQMIHLAHVTPLMHMICWRVIHLIQLIDSIQMIHILNFTYNTLTYGKWLDLWDAESIPPAVIDLVCLRKKGFPPCSPQKRETLFEACLCEKNVKVCDLMFACFFFGGVVLSIVSMLLSFKKIRRHKA